MMMIAHVVMMVIEDDGADTHDGDCPRCNEQSFAAEWGSVVFFSAPQFNAICCSEHSRLLAL